MKRDPAGRGDHCGAHCCSVDLRLPCHCGVLPPWHPLMTRAKSTTKHHCITELLSSIHILMFTTTRTTEEDGQLQYFSLSSVDSLMFGKVGLATEGFPTVVTPIGLLASMDSVMLIKV